jgi:hypothetical protein
MCSDRLWARVEVALSLPKASEAHQGTGVDLYMYNAGAELVSFIMTFLGLLVRSDYSPEQCKKHLRVCFLLTHLRVCFLLTIYTWRFFVGGGEQTIDGADAVSFFDGSRSGSGIKQEVNIIAQGAVVDWTTLWWVLLAALQFIIIVVDRSLYLRRSIRGKAALQLLTGGLQCLLLRVYCLRRSIRGKAALPSYS